MRPRTNAEVDAILRQADLRIRAPRLGDLIPSTEYDWETHQVKLGLKDAVTNQWKTYFTISLPLRDTETFTRYLEEGAAALRHWDKENA